jgi:antitoxin HigA-1
MLPTHREPTHPGEILFEEFMKPIKMSASDLAKELGLPKADVVKLINKRRRVMSRTAELLAGVFKTTPDFWMNLQKNYDDWESSQEAEPE